MIELEDRVLLLEAELDRLKERSKEAQAQAFRSRERLSERVRYLESVLSFVVPILTAAGAFIAVREITRAWGSGDVWTAIAVAVVAVAVVLSLNDLKPPMSKSDD